MVSEASITLLQAQTILKVLLVEFMTRMLNVDLYLALGLDTVSMGIYALSYIATKQIRNVQQ